MLELNQKNFLQSLEEHETLIIDFWAPWCGPCRQFGPVFDKTAEEYEGDVTFAKFNTEENQELSTALGVMTIPRVMAFRGGYMVYQSGAMNQTRLNKLADQISELDIEQLKREAEQQAADVIKATKADAAETEIAKD